MEPPAGCQQETPALTAAAAEFLSLIGGCPPKAVSWGCKAGGHLAWQERGPGRGGLSRVNGERLSPACAVGETEAGECPGPG